MPDLKLAQPEVTSAVDPIYTQPAIVHELHLEARAGSPLGGDPLSDPLGLDPAKSA